jgi:hypothetical protein
MFADHLSSSQMDYVNNGWLLLYVQNRISFRAIESRSFIKVVRRTRTACVTTGRLPRRRNLGGWMLYDLYVEVKKRVTDLLVSWDKHCIVTFDLDGWENDNKSHIVNFLCMSGGAEIFLDSVYTGGRVADCRAPGRYSARSHGRA